MGNGIKFKIEKKTLEIKVPSNLLIHHVMIKEQSLMLPINPYAPSTSASKCINPVTLLYHLTQKIFIGAAA